MSDIKTRLLIYIEAIDSNPRKFSVSIGKSDGYVRTIKGAIGSDVIGDILRIYPNLNVNWLITGEGDNMFYTSEQQTNDDGLVTYLKARVKELEEENKKLLIENTKLQSDKEKKDYESKTA